MGLLDWFRDVMGSGEPDLPSAQELRYQLKNAYRGKIPHPRRKVYSHILGNLWQFSNEDILHKPISQFVNQDDLRLLTEYSKTCSDPKNEIMAEAKEMIGYWQEPGVDEITLQQFELLLTRIFD